MVEHAWSVLAEKTRIDSETNNLTLDVLEQLNLDGEQPPEGAPGIIVPVKIELVSLWYRRDRNQAARVRARLTVQDPTGNQVGSSNLEIDLTNHERHRSRTQLTGLPVARPFASGRYHFLVEVEGTAGYRQVANIPLQVNVRLAPPN